MRLVSKIIEVTAEKTGLGKEQQKKMGVTAANIVFSRISSFEDFIRNLLEFCQDSTINGKTVLAQNEGLPDVLLSAA